MEDDLSDIARIYRYPPFDFGCGRLKPSRHEPVRERGICPIFQLDSNRPNWMSTASPSARTILRCSVFTRSTNKLPQATPTTRVLAHWTSCAARSTTLGTKSEAHPRTMPC